MPFTIIDSLVVTLGLDASKYKQGSAQAQADLKKTREEAARTAKDMEESGKRAAAFFGKLRNEALMFVGVLAGAAGIKAFTTNTIRHARALGFQSQALDMNIKRLQAWEKAARQAGASGSDVTAQLAQSQNAIAMTRRGLLAPGVQEFRFYGGKGNVQGMTPEQYLLARFAVIQRIQKQSGTASARLAAQQMGVSDSLFNFALEGNGKIAGQLSYFQKLSGYTEQDAKSANKLTNQFFILKDQVQLVGIRIASALMPYLQKLVDWFNKLAAWVDTHQDTIVSWVNDTVEAIKKFWKEVNSAAKAVGGWKNVLLALIGLKVLSAIGPLFRLASALLLVGQALGLIKLGGAAVGIIASAAGAAVASGVALGMFPNQSIAGGDSDAIAQIQKKTPKQVRDAQMQAIAFFMKKGLSKEQAIGLVANLTAESGMSAGAVGDNGKAYGLAQWHSDRQSMFRKLYGMDIRKATEQQQLEFVWWELTHSHKKAGDALRSASNDMIATRVVQNQYEMPKERVHNLSTRQGIAGQLYGYMDTHADPTRQVLPVNSLNTLNVATGRYDSRPITTSTSSSEMHVNGPVTIQTNATDAKGILGDMNDYFRKNVFATQANTGLM